MKTIENISNIASKYFAIWVIIISVVAFLAPPGFILIAQFIVPLLGIIMFGMGLTLKLSDFKIVFKQPIPVIIGVLAQFIIMPLVAFILAKLLNLPPEIAAGLVLVGACPGGTASNVMVYIAKRRSPFISRHDIDLDIASANFNTCNFTRTCRTMASS